MDTLIRLDDVRKRYDNGGRPALDGVRLEVAADEAVPGVTDLPWPGRHLPAHRISVGLTAL